jgi:AcrR family transcriptional regulator
MARPGRRTELLDAAVAVIRRDGATALTLDAVAAQAGVSKGGVLYHFASKQALVDGLVNRWLDDFEAQLTGDDLLADYARACDLGPPNPDRTATEFGMLAALIGEPAALEAARGRYSEWMTRILAGAADTVDAWVVRLAADGLWYSDLLGVAPPEGDDRRRLIARLVALAEGGAR